MLSVAAFAGGQLVPSARFRMAQYVPHLAQLGVDVTLQHRLLSSYPPRSVLLRPAWLAGATLEQALTALTARSFAVTWLQRSLISTLFTVERCLKRPIVLDVDDAIFLRRSGKTARRLVAISDHIICGNDYLADWFSESGKPISIIPTAVDTQRFVPAMRRANAEVVVGWVGTSSNLPELIAIAPAVVRVMKENPSIVLQIVCNRPPQLPGVDCERLRYIPWTTTREVENFQSMDIGLMPLRDTAWTRGKCSFKMLQYMACGLPVVVSPVGMNQQVLQQAFCGLGAATLDDWYRNLSELVSNAAARAELGRTGRELVERSYNTVEVASRLASVLRAAAGTSDVRNGATGA